MNPLGYLGGFYVFLVESNQSEPHQVAICDNTGDVWCSCDDFWFRRQCRGLPNILNPQGVCKHAKAVIESL